MKLEESKTGTAPKKGKGSGRSKKSQDIYEESSNDTLKHFKKEVLEMIISYLFNEKLSKQNKQNYWI